MGRVYRFFIEGRSDDLGSDMRIIPHGGQASSNIGNDEILDQLTKVLRVKSGDEIILLDEGNRFGEEFFEYQYEVVSSHKKEVALKFVDKLPCQNELGFEMELILCLPNKPDKLSLIMQKAVELGVSRVVLVEGDNSQMKHGLKSERLGRILKEAAEQSERAYVPVVEFDKKLNNYLGDLSESERQSVYIAMERLDETGGFDFSGEGKCIIVVGPEGGFSDVEKAFINDQEFKVFSLGKRILRMETAAIVALGMASLSSPSR